jgi:hypothetical protein
VGTVVVLAVGLTVGDHCAKERAIGGVGQQRGGAQQQGTAVPWRVLAFEVGPFKGEAVGFVCTGRTRGREGTRRRAA